MDSFDEELHHSRAMDTSYRADVRVQHVIASSKATLRGVIGSQIVLHRHRDPLLGCMRIDLSACAHLLSEAPGVLGELETFGWIARSVDSYVLYDLYTVDFAEAKERAKLWDI